MDAHDREYAGAVAGFRESAGLADHHAHAVGDFVSGTALGRRWSGHVQAVDGTRMVVEVSGDWLVVSTAHAVGDFVSGTALGRRWSGHVQAVDGTRMVVEVSGDWLVVSTADITH